MNRAPFEAERLDQRQVRWVRVRRAWPRTWTIGVSWAWADDATGCAMIHFGPWVLILGPHLSR